MIIFKLDPTSCKALQLGGQTGALRSTFTQPIIFFFFHKVSRLDGTYRTVVISTELSNPRGIAVYPAKGLMFWTDGGYWGKVERSAMDGTDRHALVQKGSASVRAPVGITLDYQEDKVYWVDEFLDVIWKMDLDGGKNYCNK